MDLHYFSFNNYTNNGYRNLHGWNIYIHYKIMDNYNNIGEFCDMLLYYKMLAHMLIVMRGHRYLYKKKIV